MRGWYGRAFLVKTFPCTGMLGTLCAVRDLDGQVSSPLTFLQFRRGRKSGYKNWSVNVDYVDPGNEHSLAKISWRHS